MRQRPNNSLRQSIDGQHRDGIIGCQHAQPRSPAENSIRDIKLRFRSRPYSKARNSDVAQIHQSRPREPMSTVSVAGELEIDTTLPGKPPLIWLVR